MASPLAGGSLRLLLLELAQVDLGRIVVAHRGRAESDGVTVVELARRVDALAVDADDVRAGGAHGDAELVALERGVLAPHVDVVETQIVAGGAAEDVGAADVAEREHDPRSAARRARARRAATRPGPSRSSRSRTMPRAIDSELSGRASPVADDGIDTDSA